MLGRVPIRTYRTRAPANKIRAPYAPPITRGSQRAAPVGPRSTAGARL